MRVERIDAGSLAVARTDSARREILRVAQALFAQGGVRSTSLTQLATALGVTRAAVYYYFPTKAEIVRETVSENARRFQADLLDPVPEGLRARERLMAYVDRRLRRIENGGQSDLRFFYTMMIEDVDEPDVQKIFRDVWRTALDALTSLIAQGVRDGDFRSGIDAEAQALATTGSVVGIDLLWLNDPSRVPLRRAYGAAIANFLDAVEVSRA